MSLSIIQTPAILGRSQHPLCDGTLAFGNSQLMIASYQMRKCESYQQAIDHVQKGSIQQLGRHTYYCCFVRIENLDGF